MSYLKRFMESADLRLDHALAGIDPKKKEVRFANGVTVPYKGLVSSVPLPDLIPTHPGRAEGRRGGRGAGWRARKWSSSISSSTDRI